jgi:hypothetical protein
VETLPQPEDRGKTRDELGKLAGMSGRQYDNYERVYRDGTPALVEAV